MKNLREKYGSYVWKKNGGTQLDNNTNNVAPKVGWSTAKNIVRKFVLSKKNLLLLGIPGIGKTALVRIVVSELGYNLIIFHPVISDPTDFKGMPWMFRDAQSGKERCVFVPFDQLEALINADEPTVCFLDDFGQASDAVQAASMQLLHGGHLAGKKLSEHVTFVACTNGRGQRAGVNSILEPVKSRFHGIVELTPELDPFCKYLSENGHSPVLVAFMRNRPQWLYGGEDGWKPTAEIVNQPCPRTIDHLGDVINMAFQTASEKFAVYAGAVGKSMGNEYLAFEQLATELPDMDLILTNPDSVPAPKDQEICYALIGALHSRMDRQNLGNIYTYVQKHFSLELQAVFHWDIGSYNPNLTHHKAYIDWSTVNGNVMINS